MSEDARATTVLLVGALLVRLAVGGAYARYVRGGMGPLLLAAGILLVILGVAGVVRAFTDQPVPVHGGHDHGERVGWLLLVPVLALLLVTPPALGSFGVDRGAAVDVSDGGRTFEALKPGGPPVPMSLLEYGQRTADHGGASFGAVPVRLTGFVADPDHGPGFRIARYQIACCAADAVASVVRVVGASGAPPARDRWVTVTGVFQRGTGGVPELRVTGLVEIRTPSDPYE